MTLTDALDSLITFAPTWPCSIEERLAYDKTRQHSRYSIFLHPPDYSTPQLYMGSNLPLLLEQAKSFIYSHRVETLLTQ